MPKLTALRGAVARDDFETTLMFALRLPKKVRDQFLQSALSVRRRTDALKANAIRGLLRANAAPTTRNEDGDTALSLAVRFRDDDLVLELLEVYGVRADDPTSNALHWAARTGNVPIAKLLLAHNAHSGFVKPLSDDITTTARLGETQRAIDIALHPAAPRGAAEIGQLLLIKSTSTSPPWQVHCTNSGVKIATRHRSH